MKSIRPNLSSHAAEGDERIRTAVPAPSTDSVYVGRSATLTAGEQTGGGIGAPLAMFEGGDRRALSVPPAPAVSAVAGQDERRAG